jgi:hypothetical protein
MNQGENHRPPRRGRFVKVLTPSGHLVWLALRFDIARRRLRMRGNEFFVAHEGFLRLWFGRGRLGKIIAVVFRRRVWRAFFVIIEYFVRDVVQALFTHAGDAGICGGLSFPILDENAFIGKRLQQGFLIEASGYLCPSARRNVTARLRYPARFMIFSGTSFQVLDSPSNTFLGDSHAGMNRAE